MNNDLLDKVYTVLKENKKIIEEGKINGIPFPFKQLHDCIPIIKKGQYHLITAKTKHSKSQITNYIFVFEMLFYAYNNPDLVSPHILYFNWEEGDEEILERFMSYCLYRFSKGQIRLSPIELESPDKNRLLDSDTLDLLESDSYKKLFQYFVDHVEFCSDIRTTVAIDIKVKSFAKEHGDIILKEAFYNDENGIKHTTKSIGSYEYSNQNQYVFLLFDHVSLIQTIKGQTLLQAISELSKRCVTYKNIFQYIVVMIQQQSKELGGLESTKQGRIRPDDTFLSDCKSTVNECTHFWGICDPVAFNLTQYLNYDLTKLGHNLRILELIVNRKGEGNKLLPLYFDGAVNFFAPMPEASNKTQMESIYNRIQQNKSRKSILMILRNYGKLYNYFREKRNW